MLSYLSTRSLSLVDGLDDADGDRLPHVTHGETSERCVVCEFAFILTLQANFLTSESLNAEWLGGDELDNSGITVLEGLGAVLDLLSGTAVDLLLELVELASDVG